MDTLHLPARAPRNLLPVSSKPRLVAVLTAALFIVWLACRREEPLERLWVAPAFALVDQQGRPFGSADLAGRAAVLSFVYTHCTDTARYSRRPWPAC